MELPFSWEELERERACKLEMELARELPQMHPLAGKRCRAIAARVSDDDVLFQVEDTKNNFAVVHLTWRGLMEVEGDPWTTFYPSIEHFIQFEISQALEDSNDNTQP